MNIVSITGGLGNQMFQYALCLALKSAGHTVKLDISKYDYYKIHNNYELEDVFGINEHYASKSEVKKYGYLKDNRVTRFLLKTPWVKKSIFRENDRGYLPEVFLKKDSYFKGYWQNQEYFKNITHEIRSKYRFKPFDTEEQKCIAKKIQSCISVSLHIRRGDYLKHPLYSGLCQIDYYTRAYEYLKEKIEENFEIFVFSNDVTWVKENFCFPKMYIIDCNQGKESYRDMQLMSLCKHNIIANSSFSWWGAWLNNNEDKIVIAPKVWVNSTKPAFQEIVPEGWIKL